MSVTVTFGGANLVAHMQLSVYLSGCSDSSLKHLL